MSDLRVLFRERVHPLYRLRKFGPTRRALALADVPLWARVPGVAWKIRIRLVRHASYVFLPRSPEPEVVALMLALVRLLEPRSFCDVGANFGYYGWLLRSRNPALRLTMVEPDPDNLALIRATIERNDLDDVRVIAAAADDASGSALFHADPISGATGTLSAVGSFASVHWRTSDLELVVATTTLDDVLGDDGADLVKLDVEGFEARVLGGARGTLERHRPALVLEATHQRAEALRVLGDAGYVVVPAHPGADLASSENLLALPVERKGLLPDLPAGLGAGVAVRR